jgi:DNA repair exonuclease SbcCD ATPase subunit
VAVTGPNGSGKSTIIEAVSTALWGESLRGEAGWRAGEQGAVAVTTDGVKATRKRSKAGTQKLEWSPAGADGATYETTTKAQAALEAAVGSYDVWRRTCVLSSLDSAAFSTARDSDRKRLLEEFLGLGMFDIGLAAVRADLKATTAALAEAKGRSLRAATACEWATTALEQSRRDEADLLAATGGRTPEQIRSDLARVEGLLQGATRDAKAAQQEVARLRAAGQAQDAAAAAEGQRLARLRGDECPACGQSVADVRAHLAQEVSRAKAEANAARQAVAGELAAAVEAAEEFGQEEAALVARRQVLAADLRVADGQARQRAGVADRVTQGERKLTDALRDAATAQADVTRVSREADELEAVEVVLGLRGVRAQVLDHALGALEAATNGWLGEMPTEAGPLRVTISGSTTQKTGGVVDAISLRVGERAYASCSGGERRRVDVALLLALRELAVAAHGRDGTIFADEVFDALDGQGCEDVAEALREMAHARLVVVITHSPLLLATLRPDHRLQVERTEAGVGITTRSA